MGGFLSSCLASVIWTRFLCIHLHVYVYMMYNYSCHFHVLILVGTEQSLGSLTSRGVYFRTNLCQNSFKVQTVMYIHYRR